MTHWRISERVDLLRERPNRVGGPAIATNQSRRQMHTAVEILHRLRDHPGQILADEVGMGKTYTALAVAASVALENPKAGPVVIMVPPALRDKWPLDWEVFRELYITGPAPRVARADRGIDFLKLIDNAPNERAQIIFLKNGAFGVQLGDPWVKLAVVRQALLRRRTMSRERRAVEKWGARVVRAPDFERHRSGLVPALLGAPYPRWKSIARRFDLELDDDPIPEALVETIERLDLGAVREALALLPTNRSKSSEHKINEASRQIDRAIKALWKDWLASAEFRAPLLILDEAHHAKNPGAQLSRLFLNEEQGGGESPGTLYERFDRMLFLTATPFQLGHHELLQILSRFGGVNWRSLPGDQMAFDADIGALGKKLSTTQRAMANLDRSWGRLKPEDVDGLAEQWWTGSAAAAHLLPERPRRARRAFDEALRARKRSEPDLQRWVIRHRKPDNYSTGTPRRRYLRGAEIVGGSANVGLDVDRGTLLPFLLAARAQVSFRTAQRNGDIPVRARALFADGICSSYEAYLDTRRGLVVDEEGHQAEGSDGREIKWYLKAIQGALPADDSEARASHPKIGPVVNHVREHWRRGEKVVVFCHFRATGAALRRHISRAIETELWTQASDAFQVAPGEVRDTIQRLSRRFERRGESTSPVHDAAYKELFAIASQARGLDEEQRSKVVDVFLRYLRSPVVLARYGHPVQARGADGVDGDARSAGSRGRNASSPAGGFQRLHGRPGQRSARPLTQCIGPHPHVQHLRRRQRPCRRGRGGIGAASGHRALS